MKIILAIINNDDAPIVSNQLTRAGINVTKMASTGGFLMRGNSTFISGVEDDQVDKAIEIIKKYSQRRGQMSPIQTVDAKNPTVSEFPAEISVGGATMFVLNVERCERA